MASFFLNLFYNWLSCHRHKQLCHSESDIIDLNGIPVSNKIEIAFNIKKFDPDYDFDSEKIIPSIKNVLC